MQAWLIERATRLARADSVPRQAKLELGLWRDHMRAELARSTWTTGEIGCIADILNGTALDAQVGSLLWADLSDAFEGMGGAYGKKWGIDEDALVAKARALGPTACHALVEAVARWWADPASQPDAESWRAVGLRVIQM